MNRLIPIQRSNETYLGFYANNMIFHSFEKATQFGEVSAVVLKFKGFRLTYLSTLAKFKNNEFPIWRTSRKKFLTYEDAMQPNKRTALLKSSYDDPNKVEYIINTNK